MLAHHKRAGAFKAEAEEERVAPARLQGPNTRPRPTGQRPPPLPATPKRSGGEFGLAGRRTIVVTVSSVASSSVFKPKNARTTKIDSAVDDQAKPQKFYPGPAQSAPQPAQPAHRTPGDRDRTSTWRVKHTNGPREGSTQNGQPTPRIH